MRHNPSVVVGLALMGAVATGPALANPPTPANSTVPSHIHLVGSNGVQPSTEFGEFEVVHRDLANNPIAGATITVDLSGHLDLRLCDVQPYPGIQLDCANKRASVITDAAGRARFALIGSSHGGPASTLNAGAPIFANGTLIGFPFVSAFDLDGAFGVGGADLSVFIVDFVSGQPWERSDFDGSGNLGGGDLAFWLTAFGSGSQIVSCAATCP